MMVVNPEPPRGSNVHLRTSKDAAEKFLDRLTIKLNTEITPEASKFLFTNVKPNNSFPERCAKLLTGKVQKIVKAYQVIKTLVVLLTTFSIILMQSFQDTIGCFNCKLLSKLNLLSTTEDLKVTIDRTDFTSYILLLTEQYKKFSEQLR